MGHHRTDEEIIAFLVEDKIRVALAAKQSNNKYLSKEGSRLKMAARQAVYLSLRAGKVEKGVCHCGETKVDAHHPDYSKPLEVVWLCRKHHWDLHKSLSRVS
jgi:hypothetical protein